MDTLSRAQDNGRKRFIVTDTMGLLIVVVVLAPVCKTATAPKPPFCGPTPRHRGPGFIFADGAFVGRLIEWAAHILSIVIAVVRKPTDQQGFAVIPRRWQWNGPSPGSPRTAGWPGTMNATPSAPRR